MDHYELLVDLHKGGTRQGPGGEDETKKAIELAMLDPATPLHIADIGCGTGASTLQLASSLNAQITAVDLSPEFIEVLVANAARRDLSEKILPLVGSMGDLPFAEGEYDVLWSEGAIYNLGFAQGINNWRRFLKPGGLLVVSELTWITGERPAEIQRHWEAEYPETGTASSKIDLLEKSGYSPVAYFILPEHCWLENYYRPLQSRFTEFLARHSHRDEALAVTEAENEEIALYEKYKSYYSYGVYIARKTG
jgi:SAM-dependent methyltransferase